jgi:rubrerythrin
MELKTLSAVLSFAEKVEDKTAGFYESLASKEKFLGDRELFLGFAEENKKHKQQVKRVYQESITDAFEIGGSFNLNSSDYSVDTTLPGDMSYPDILKRAMELEEKTGKFYLNSSEQSNSLLTDISRIFKVIAKKKSERRLKLSSLYQETKGGLDD